MSLAEQDDRFEVELASRFSDLREAFLSRARSDINRIIVLDASQPLSCINQQIQDIIQKKFSSLFTQEGKI
jgi:thymidylate kinase